MTKLENYKIGEIIEILKKGGVIAHPADTCFGLAGDFRNPDTVRKIQLIKGRDFKKPMSIMLPISFKGRISGYAVLDDYAQSICDEKLPGKVTLLLPKGPKIPEHYFSETDIIGIRIPDDDLTQAILEGFGGPLITTSANPAGGELCYTSDEARKAFADGDIQPDMIVEGVIKERGPASSIFLVEKEESREIERMSSRT